LHRVAQFAQGEQAQPAMVFGQDKRFAACGQGVSITRFDRFSRHPLRKVQVFFPDRDINAGGQPH